MILHASLAGIPEVPEDCTLPLIHLTRVEDVVGIHCLLDGLDGGELGRPLLHVVGCLGDSDPVLTGDGSAEFDTDIEDLVDGLDASLPLVLVGGVDDHLGVEVSVGCVSVCGDGHIVLGGDLLESLDGLGDLGDRHSHVVRKVNGEASGLQC